MPSYHCRICKRPLSDSTSIKLGMGPVCRGRDSIQPYFDILHAEYVVLDVKYNYILIKDTGHETHKSVTNDVEFVLTSLAENFDIQYRRIFYVNSTGGIDEILHTGKIFHGFKPGHEGVTL